MNSKPDTATNMGTMFAYMDQAARNGADLVVFPEMALQGCPGWREEHVKPTPAERAYIQQSAETIPGPSTEALVAKAKALNLHVVFGMTEKDAAGLLYNTAVYLGPAGVLGKHRKTTLVGNEDLIWRISAGWDVIDSPLGKVGLMICAEMAGEGGLFPGPVLAGKGADLLVSSSAWWSSVGPSWNYTTALNAVRAGRWHIVSNQVGTIGYAVVYGHSRIVDPAGREVGNTGAKEGLVIWSTDMTVDANSSQ
jgi:predicted amidohydrolase